MKRLLFITLGAALGAACAPSVFAQYTPYTPGNYSYEVIQGTLQTNQLRTTLGRGGAGRRRSSGGSVNSTGARSSKQTAQRGRKQGSTSAGPAARATATFQPVAPMLMPQQLARDIAKRPEDRPKLERMFSDLLGNYTSNSRRGGPPLYDVARAASYLISASHAVYNGSDKPLSDAQYRALRRQMDEEFAADEQFQRMTDREKQLLFENYAITGAWTDVGYGIVRQKGDRKAMAQWQQMAKQNLEHLLGMPATRIRLTEAGIEYR